MKRKLVWIIPITALAVALLDLPYGYYVLLRLLVCGVCIYLANVDAKAGRNGWVWVLGGLAVLYNPVVKLSVGKELWPFVNVATIVLFLFHMWLRRPHSGTGNSSGSGP